LIKDNLNSFIADSNSTVFITKTADEFIFKGYSDPFLDAQANLPPGLLDIPSYDKFGWFYGVSYLDFQSIPNMTVFDDLYTFKAQRV
jgi:hypothetical protein